MGHDVLQFLNLFAEEQADIKTCVDQINSCFDILIPKPSDLFEDFPDQSQNELNKGKWNQVEAENSPDSSDTDDDMVEVEIQNNNEEELQPKPHE